MARVPKQKPAKNKTSENAEASVDDFIAALGDDRRRDCEELMRIMKRITRSPPVMWGKSIVGFGRYQYQYASGRCGHWFEAGFSPRKQSLTLYVMGGLSAHENLLDELGPHKAGKSCLYVKRLGDIHLPTLKKLITRSVAKVRNA